MSKKRSIQIRDDLQYPFKLERQFCPCVVSEILNNQPSDSSSYNKVDLIKQQTWIGTTINP